MILDTLSKYPEIGIGSTVGTSAVHYLGLVNPILSTVSLVIGISVGLTTLYLQVRKIKNNNNKIRKSHMLVGVVINTIKENKSSICDELNGLINVPMVSEKRSRLA